MKNEKRLNEKGLKARLARILTHEKWSGITVPIFCIILMLIVSSVLLLLIGKNPLTAFYSFLAGNGFAAKASYGAGSGMMSDFFQFLNVMAPMLLAALAFIFAYRCGLFNIGIAGQMLLSGFMATITVGYMQNLPGALVSRASKVISSQSRLTLTKVNVGGYLCNLPMGIIIAVVMAFLVYFIFEKTVFGFELKAVGSNRNAARYSGINVGRQLVFAMMISGMLAGLAGVTYYLGYTNQILPKTLAGMGYDAIATALLGSSHPIGAIFSSMLITVFQNGSNYMSSVLGVAKEIASVITGILLLFSACGGFFRFLAKGYLDKLAFQKSADEKAAAKEKGGDRT